MATIQNNSNPYRDILSLGLLGVIILVSVLRNLSARYVVFIILYMASISNIFDVGFVLPIFVVSILQQNKYLRYA